MHDDSQKAPLDPRAVGGAILEAADKARIAIAITMVDGVGPHNVFLNEHAIALLGYPREEILALPVWALIAPEELPRFKKMREERLLGRLDPLQGETVVVRKDGSRLPVEFSGCQISLGGHPATVSFFGDITERRRAADALEASETRFRTLVQSAPDAMAIVKDGRFVFLNPRAVGLLGRERAEEVIGAPLAEMLSPEDGPRAATRMMEVIDRGAPLEQPAEYRVRWPDGSEHLVEIASIPIEYDDGPAVLAVGRDVTARKALEAQLIQADRLAAAGRLAAGVAHEINNPLTYALLQVESMLRELPGAGQDPDRTPTLVERLRDVDHGIRRVATIVRDLRSFAQPDAGERGAVDLRAVLRRSIQVAGTEFRHRATLIEDYADVSAVDGNAARLEQVFVNLLTNAAQALTRSPVREIRVRTWEENDLVMAAVTDTGAGMDQAVLGRIFDPFFTTKSPAQGTGLGLSITRSIVQGLGGEIHISSHPGQGTTCKVCLQRHAGPDRPVSPAPAEPAMAPEGARRVLVVDDEELVARPLRTFLERRGFVPTVVGGGRDALHRLDRGECFDVVLCDLIMPEMTGSELYRALLERHPRHAERVVFMTGGAASPDVAAFLENTDRPVLEKPFDLGRLAEVLREVAMDREQRERKPVT